MELIQYNIINNSELKGVEILFKKNGKPYSNDDLENILSDNEIFKTEEGLYFASVEEYPLTDEEFLNILQEIEDETHILFEKDVTIQLPTDYKTDMYYIVNETQDGLTLEIVTKSFFDKYQLLDAAFNLKLESVLSTHFKEMERVAENIFVIESVKKLEDVQQVLNDLPCFKFEKVEGLV